MHDYDQLSCKKCALDRFLNGMAEEMGAYSMNWTRVGGVGTLRVRKFLQSKG